MKGQMNIDFIVSSAVFIAVMVFILLMIYGTFPPLHKESVYTSITAKAFQAARLLVDTPGLWNGPGIANVSIMGLSNGMPGIINMSKARALDNCNSSDYNKTKALLGMSQNENMAINISLVNFNGGPDTRVAFCRTVSYSSSRSMVVITRYGAADDTPGAIVRVDMMIY